MKRNIQNHQVDFQRQLVKELKVKVLADNQHMQMLFLILKIRVPCYSRNKIFVNKIGLIVSRDCLKTART